MLNTSTAVHRTCSPASVGSFLLPLSLRTLINWERTWPYGISTCFVFLCMSFREIVKCTLVVSDLSFLL